MIFGRYMEHSRATPFAAVLPQEFLALATLGMFCVPTAVFIQVSDILANC